MDFGYEYYDIKMEKCLNSQYMDAEKKMELQILRNENITNVFIRKFIGLGIVFLMLLIMNSCGGEDDPIEPDTPTVSEIVLADKSQSTLEFDAGASTQTVRFSTTQAWSAEVSSGDWCTVSPASGSAGNGSITVSVSENTEEAERNATVTLKAGEASLDLEVTQSLTSFDVEEVAGYITEVTETVDELFMQSGGIAELSQNIEEIRSLDGVQDVSATDDALYVEIKDGGIISWYYPPKSEPMDVNATADLLPKSFHTSVTLTKGLASDHKFIEPKKFCIINQTVNDEKMDYIASKLSTLKNTLDDVFDIDFVRGEDADLDFFSSLTNYDCIFFETHGGYFNNQHWLTTGESVTDEAREWLESDAGLKWRDKGLDIVTLKEVRKSKEVNIAYWAISEKFIESMSGSFDNSIIFSDACQSLMGNNTLALAFQKKGAGVYLGYDNDNRVGYKAGKAFWENLSLGMTVEQAFGNIPGEYKIDSKNGAVLHFYPQSNGNLCIVHPEVNTSDATNIGGTTATLQGEITGWIESLKADEAEAGFCWGKNANPLVEDSQVKSQRVSNYQKKENTISLSEDLVELEPNSTYYYRAFLKMNDEYYYGDVKEFETGESDGMREFLVKLYHDTDGDNWTRNDNWLSDKPITEWYGVSHDYYITSGYRIQLVDNNLKGKVDLSNCSMLHELNIRENDLITAIDVSNCEYLRRLKLLVHEGKVEYIDASGCINLAEAEYLFNVESVNLSNSGIGGYFSASDVKKIDVSNTEIEVVNMNRGNTESLNLSGCKKLKTVLCFDNQLSDLKVSGCDLLEELNCSGNKLSVLDIIDCPFLESIDCSDNILTSLNFENCPALKSINCSENKLQNLVLSLPNLESIFCSNNELVNIDLLACPNIGYVGCANNKIFSIVPEYLKSVTLAGDFRYEYYYDYSEKKTKYREHSVGWWYPGEPESGKHAWSDE